MRFVTPDVVRKTLSNGDWIEIKKELTTGEEKRFRSAGFRHLTPANEQEPAKAGEAAKDATETKIDVDWARLALARVETYLVDWSAKKPDGKDMPVTRAYIEALHPDDFDEIDKIIQAHIQEQADAKKATPGEPKPTLTSS